MKIQVYGSGCKGCHVFYNEVSKVVKELDLKCELEYISDITKMIELGVMTSPVLVINDKIVSQGKSLKASEIEKLIKM